MALKKAVKPHDEDKFLELMKEVTDIDQKIYALQQRKEEVQREMLEIKLRPFKIGQTVLADIPSGRSRKLQKCLLECEGGTLYLRPVKNDGELSGRHFSMTPVGGKTYADYLKECGGKD